MLQLSITGGLISGTPICNGSNGVVSGTFDSCTWGNVYGPLEINFIAS